MEMLQLRVFSSEDMRHVFYYCVCASHFKISFEQHGESFTKGRRIVHEGNTRSFVPQNLRNFLGRNSFCNRSYLQPTAWVHETREISHDRSRTTAERSLAWSINVCQSFSKATRTSLTYRKSARCIKPLHETSEHRSVGQITSTCVR